MEQSLYLSESFHKLVGSIGGCFGIEPILAGGDSVIRVRNFINTGDVTFPEPETLVQNISESVSVQVT